MLIIFYLSALICGAKLFHITKTFCMCNAIKDYYCWIINLVHVIPIIKCLSIHSYLYSNRLWLMEKLVHLICATVYQITAIFLHASVFTACWFSSSLAFPLQCWHVVVKLAAYTGCLENMFKQFECCFGVVLFVPKLTDRVIPEPRAGWPFSS